MDENSPTRRNRYGEPTAQRSSFATPRLPRLPYRLRRNRYGLPRLVDRSGNPKTPKDRAPDTTARTDRFGNPKVRTDRFGNPKAPEDRAPSQRAVKVLLEKPDFRSRREKVGFYVSTITAGAAIGALPLWAGSALAIVAGTVGPPLVTFIGWWVWLRWGRARFPHSAPPRSDSQGIDLDA